MDDDKTSEVFNKWNRLKIRIHNSEDYLFPKKGEIWWISIGQNIDIETNGKNYSFERPVVVIKVFNSLSVLVAPTTSKVKHGKYFINFINDKNKQNSINMSQIRSVSVKRFLRKIGEMKNQDFEKVKNVLRSFVR